MSAERTEIGGLWLLAAKSVTDERGTVREFFRASAFASAGLPVPGNWSQVNVTWTRRGALRGVHGEAISKLVGRASGSALGAYGDARRGSPTYGAVVTAELEPGAQVLVPPGVCNGFQALTDCAYLYCFDAEWQPDAPGVAVNALDPQLAIPWPVDPPIMSAKDAAAPAFADVACAS